MSEKTKKILLNIGIVIGIIIIIGFITLPKWYYGADKFEKGEWVKSKIENIQGIVLESHVELSQGIYYTVKTIDEKEIYFYEWELERTN